MHAVKPTLTHHLDHARRASAADKIKNSSQRIDEYLDNCAQRTIKATKGPGKHKVIVEGRYYKPDGTKCWSTKELEYVIAE